MTDSELQQGQEILKNLTVEDLQIPEGQERFNQAAGKYIRSKIKSTSLFYKVIPPRSVTEDELVPLGDATDGQPDLRYRMPGVSMLDPSKSVKAMLMDMRGKPVPNYTDGRQQLFIPMGVVKTKRFEKTPVELLAAGSLLKLVEEMASWEVKERDRKFLKYCELAVKKSGQVLRKSGPLQRDHFREIQHPAIQNEIESKVVLLAKTAVMDLDLEKSAARISGMECIYSQDDDVLAPTVVWSFPTPDLLGYNLCCGDYKFYSKQEKVELWSFQGWETIGAGIGNINGVTKLILGFMAGESKIPDNFDRMGGPKKPMIPAEYRADVVRAVDICKEEGCRDVFVLGSNAVRRHGSQAGLDIGIRGCPANHFYRLLGRLMEELAYPVGLIDLDRETRIAELLEREGQLVHVG